MEYGIFIWNLCISEGLFSFYHGRVFTASPNEPWQQNTDCNRELLSQSSLCKATEHHFKLQGLRQGIPELKDQIFPFCTQSISTCQPPFPQGFSLCCSVPIPLEKVTKQHWRRMLCRSCPSSRSGRGLWWMWHTSLKQKLWLSDKLGGLVQGSEQGQPVTAEISSRAVRAPWNKSGSSIRASTKIKPDTPVS